MIKIKMCVQKIKKNLKKFKNNKFYRAKFIYTKYYDKLKINEKEIIIESYDGKNISCNPYYLLKELCKKEYDEYTKYVVANAKNKSKIKDFLKLKGLVEVKILIKNSKM